MPGYHKKKNKQKKAHHNGEPHDHPHKKKEDLKKRLAKINDDNTRGDVDKDKDEHYKSIESNEYYNKHDADMGGYNKDILDKVQLKNQKKVKKGKKVPQDKIRETPTKENYYQTHMDSKGAFEQRALKEKVKKADLSGIVKEQKKKKGKERLVHKASKGVDTYSSQDPKNSKVKKKHVKGKVSKQLTALRKKVNKIKNNPPQGPSGGTADTPEAIRKDAEAVAKTPSYIAKDHDHTITFKGYKGAQYKRASLISNTGKYAKYWLLNAKQTNGNGWGVSQQSIAKNIHKFVGKPLVVTAKSWIPDSEYGDAYEHPYLPTNDISKVFDHQEKFRVGSIVDIIEKDGDYYANIELNQKFAHMVMPPFCSPAIFQNNPSEPEGQISDWEALHLAALHEDPAYGSRIALLRGTCVGTKDQCTVQFKAAKQEAKMVCTKGLKGRLSTLTAAKSPTGYLGDASVDIPWGDPDLGEEVNITFRDMAQFHRKNNWVNKQGTFPQIWNLGPLTGEGQGAREIFDAAHDVENRFVEEMGAENYQKNMQGEIDHLVKEYGEDPEGDLSFNEELTRTQDNLGMGDDVSKSRRNEIKRRQTKERLGRLKKNESLKQRIAGIQRTAFAGIHSAKPVMDAFKNKKPLRFGEKVKGRKREYAFQTDGKTLYQSGYPIAEHTKNGIKFSYQGHPTPTTSDTARYLGIDTFTKNGVTYINGQEIDPYGFDYVEVPSSDISDTPVKVNPKSKPIINEQTKQKNRDQEAFRIKAEREALKGNQDLVVQTKTKKEVLDHGSITSKEQSNINKITGVGKDKEQTFATAYDHSLPAEKGGGIGGGIINRRMSGGAVPLSRKTHFEKHFPEKTIPKSFYNRFSKLKQRLATLNMPKGGITGMEKITADYNKHKPAIKKLGNETGYTIHDGELLDFNNQEHVNKFASAYPQRPGKKGEHLYMVANTKGIHNINDKMLGTMNKDLSNQGYTSVQGGWRGKNDKRHQIDLNAVFRSKNSKKALELAKKYDQEAITEIDSVANTVRYPENPFWSGRKQ